MRRQNNGESLQRNPNTARKENQKLLQQKA